jgi:predicted membrane-bound spermidine synthase
MSKELTAFNLTEESTLNEMAAAFSFMEDKKIELLSRIKNSPLTRKEVITKYYEHLNSYINGPDKHRELDEYRISERFFYYMALLKPVLTIP